MLSKFVSLLLHCAENDTDDVSEGGIKKKHEIAGSMKSMMMLARVMVSRGLVFLAFSGQAPRACPLLPDTPIVLSD